VALLILFDLIQPEGWKIGIVRVEDIAIGAATCLVVGLLFWPRGAGGALATALADAYERTAAYLGSAISFAISGCDADVEQRAPDQDASGAAALITTVIASTATAMASSTPRSSAHQGCVPSPSAWSCLRSPRSRRSWCSSRPRASRCSPT
jgi:uncharacterized membrane protein YccC